MFKQNLIENVITLENQPVGLDVQRVEVSLLQLSIQSWRTWNDPRK